MSELKLNPEQEAAVYHPGGPLLIVAGAGAGKTAVITERIKWLITEKGLKPEQILALTFTEKAAEEMEERVDVALPLGYSRTWIMTFHGFCEQVLRADAIQIGIDPGFTLQTEAEAQLLLQDNLFKLSLNHFRPKGNPTKFLSGLLTHFSRLKDEDISPTQYKAWAEAFAQDISENSTDEQKELVIQYQELAVVYQEYEELKVQESRLDFGDLITLTLKLFRERPAVLARYQRQFPFLLLDEFQDTNYAQNHLAVLLAQEHKNITVVADDDQAIYRWRGAAVYNVLDFRTHFPDVTVVTLNRNYRSRQEILDLAYRSIQFNNPDRLEISEKIDKRLRCSRDFEELPSKHLEIIWEQTVDDEAERVAQEIKKQANGEYNSVAILVRANSHAEPFIKALKREGMPYEFLGPGNLFKQPDILTLCAYLMVLTQPSNDHALYRLMTHSTFAVPGVVIAWMLDYACTLHESLFVIAKKLLDDSEMQHTLEPEDLVALENVISFVDRSIDKSATALASEMVYVYLQESGILKTIANPTTEEDVRSGENITAFFNRVQAFESRDPEAKLHQFVTYISFLLENGDAPISSEIDWRVRNAVNIMTVHASKGLEFETVFMVNMVNQRFPSMSRKDQIPLPEELIKEPLTNEDPHIQEERRLFYVGVTRAQKKLYFTGAQFYNEGRRAKKICPFILEAVGEVEPYLLGKENSQPSLFSMQPAKQIEVEDSQLEPLAVTTLTYSAIEAFRDCPLHYKLRYLVKLPSLPFGPGSFGTAVHNCLKDAYQAVVDNEIEYTQESLYEKAIGCFEVHFAPVGFINKDHAQEQYKIAQTMLKTFSEIATQDRQKIFALEVPFSIRILPDLTLHGRIDRIDKHANGTLEVIDYKTGRNPGEKELKKDLQLAIYAMAISHPQLYNQPLEKIRLTYWYLESNERIEFSKTKEEIDAAINEISSVRDEIQVSNFVCSKERFCESGQCEYRLFCMG